jgi:outer membrane protein assembly factor BamB
MTAVHREIQPCLSASRLLMLLAPVAILFVSAPALAQWPQWGGPNRNFVVQSEALADSWPEQGPRQVWKRPLGDGYSAIVVDDGVLYTMYRKSRDDQTEYTIALDAQTGQTVWESGHPSAIPQGNDESVRRFTGPNATPLICGTRLYTVGRNAVLRCFNRSEGSVLWSHDLVAEFGAGVDRYGYSPSPIAYSTAVVVSPGMPAESDPKGHSMIAFDQATGNVLWKGHDFSTSHASPVLINFDGQDQLVQHTADGVIAVDPANGQLVWEHKFPEEHKAGAMATPVWNGKDTLYCSSGTLGCGIRLVNNGNKVSAEEAWSSRKVPLGMGTPVLVGDLLVGSKLAQTGVALAVNINTGKREWLDRAFGASTYVHADGKLVILNQEGELGLATLGPKGLRVSSRCQVGAQYSFSAPTLVGSTLYLRDESHIMALDLGRGSAG